MDESIELTLDALRQANQRVQNVRDQDLSAMFAPLGEALWWTYIIDDLLRRRGGAYVSHRQAKEVGRRIRALRHARNVVTHGRQPAELAQMSQGKQYPVNYPKNFREVVFVRADEIPPTDKAPPAEAVDAWRHTPMGGRPVRVVVSETLSFLESEAGGAIQPGT